MKDIEAITEGNTEPLAKALGLLSDGESADGMSALEISCWVKLAEAYLEKVRQRLRGEANADFLALQSTAADKKQFVVADIATITAYKPRCSWEYPEELTKAYNDVQAQLKGAQKDGKATRHVPEVNPETSATFGISLMKEAL